MTQEYQLHQHYLDDDDIREEAMRRTSEESGAALIERAFDGQETYKKVASLVVENALTRAAAGRETMFEGMASNSLEMGS